jgi:sugar lactone lactonase YvrE
MEGAKEGIMVAGGQGRGNSFSNLSRPYAVMVDQSSTVYVADSSNHRVMRWSKGATQGSVIVGGNGQGGQANQFNCPTGLSFDRQGNIYVVDHGKNRVQRFNIDSSVS